LSRPVFSESRKRHTCGETQGDGRERVTGCDEKDRGHFHGGVSQVPTCMIHRPRRKSTHIQTY
jgi:hypothetical protein